MTHNELHDNFQATISLDFFEFILMKNTTVSTLGEKGKENNLIFISPEAWVNEDISNPCSYCNMRVDSELAIERVFHQMYPFWEASLSLHKG